MKHDYTKLSNQQLADLVRDYSPRSRVSKQATEELINRNKSLKERLLAILKSLPERQNEPSKMDTINEAVYKPEYSEPSGDTIVFKYRQRTSYRRQQAHLRKKKSFRAFAVKDPKI